jgi:hypothetical protein
VKILRFLHKFSCSSRRNSKSQFPHLYTPISKVSNIALTAYKELRGIKKELIRKPQNKHHQLIKKYMLLTAQIFRSQVQEMHIAGYELKKHKRF